MYKDFLFLPFLSVLWWNSECYVHHPDPDYTLLPQRLSSLHFLSLDPGCSSPGNHQSVCPDICAPTQPKLLHKLPGDERLAYGELREMDLTRKGTKNDPSVSKIIWWTVRFGSSDASNDQLTSPVVAVLCIQITSNSSSTFDTILSNIHSEWGDTFVSRETMANHTSSVQQTFIHQTSTAKAERSTWTSNQRPLWQEMASVSPIRSLVGACSSKHRNTHTHAQV